MTSAAYWPSYREQDVRRLIVDLLEKGERIECLAFGYERSGWKELAWTALRSALLAGLLTNPWPTDETLGQAYVIVLTNQRIVFVACRPAVTPHEERSGKLVRLATEATRRDAVGAGSVDGRASDDLVTLCVETATLKRCVFFEPSAIPENIERGRRLLKALRPEAPTAGSRGG